MSVPLEPDPGDCGLGGPSCASTSPCGCETQPATSVATAKRLAAIISFIYLYYARFILLLAFWGTVGNSKLATRRGPPRGCDGPRRWSGGWRFSSSRSPDDTLSSDIASSPNANSVRSG